MKRIKQIIEALKVLSRTPSKTIMDAWCSINEFAVSPSASQPSVEAVTLINNIIEAVVGVAEDMEKPAKAESETAKP
jgi:hypothetical protein